MQVCANCGHTNRPGILFCENCGTSLTGKAAVGTTKAFDDAGMSGTGPLSAAGTDYFMPNAVLRIEIEGGPEPILIKPRQELIFGRRDPATGAMPDIDLTPYAGYRMGVSRRHAAIRSADESHLDIWDLGSSNGTFLNGQRLNAHRPYRLRDGDRLRLGQMIIRLYFQPPESQISPDATGEMDVLRATNENLPGAAPANHPAGGVETAHINEQDLQALDESGAADKSSLFGVSGIPGGSDESGETEALGGGSAGTAGEVSGGSEVPGDSEAATGGEVSGSGETAAGGETAAEASPVESAPAEDASRPDEPVVPPTSE